MLKHEFDEEVNAHYFKADEENDPVIVRTVDLGARQVIFDYDAAGNVVGVEIL